jgi:recombinational DNA repair ATPase RecF
LSDIERKYLILAGKNGSGKTSLLEATRNHVLLAQTASDFFKSQTAKARANS